MNQNIFGNNLRNLRLAEHISQDELGKKLGVCNQTVSFWEIGKREPDLDMLVKIADYFNVSTDDLLRK